VSADSSLVQPPALTDACGACALAAEEALRCAEAFEDTDPSRDQDVAQCVDACHDAFTVLTATSVMLERPVHPTRMPAIRRMLEAGLVASIECAAQCDLWPDALPAAATCAQQCHGCSDVLRAALREVADESVDEMSGAT
jgi:hypothetical protein